MMIAKVRLYLTASTAALVHEGHPDGATLYCAPGDQIPDSAVERFGLVDGDLPAGAEVAAPVVPEPAPAVDIVDGLLRVRTNTGGVTIAGGLIFAPPWYSIQDEEIGEDQLLAILAEPSLDVQAALVGDPSPGWIDFPGRDGAIAELTRAVAADIEGGVPHGRVTSALSIGVASIAGAKERPGQEDKERREGENKDGGGTGGGGETKGECDKACLVALPGIGDKTADKLIAAGVVNVEQLAAIDPAAPPAVPGLSPTFKWPKVIAGAVAALAAKQGQD